MRNIILIILLTFFTVSCSEKKKEPEYGWAIPGDSVKINGTPIAFLWYVVPIESKTQKKGPVGPAVALLGTDKATGTDEGAIVIYSFNSYNEDVKSKTSFYTMLNGKKVPLTSSTLIIYDVKTKKQTSIDFSKIKEEKRLQYIKEKIKEANNEAAGDVVPPPQS